MAPCGQRQKLSDMSISSSLSLVGCTDFHAMAYYAVFSMLSLLYAVSVGCGDFHAKGYMLRISCHKMTADHS